MGIALAIPRGPGGKECAGVTALGKVRCGAACCRPPRTGWPLTPSWHRSGFLVADRHLESGSDWSPVKVEGCESAAPSARPGTLIFFPAPCHSSPRHATCRPTDGGWQVPWIPPRHIPVWWEGSSASTRSKGLARA